MTNKHYAYLTISSHEYNDFIKQVVHSVYSDGWEKVGDYTEDMTCHGKIYRQELRREVEVLGDVAHTHGFDPEVNALNAPEVPETITDPISEALKEVSGEIPISNDSSKQVSVGMDEEPDYINPHKFLRPPTSGEVSQMVELGVVDQSRPVDTISVEDEILPEVELEDGYYKPNNGWADDNEPPQEDGDSSSTSYEYYVATGLDVYTIGERINQHVKKGFEIDGEIVVTRMTDSLAKYTQRLRRVL